MSVVQNGKELVLESLLLSNTLSIVTRSLNSLELILCTCLMCSRGYTSSRVLGLGR
jgi:hypothetical protein